MSESPRFTPASSARVARRRFDGRLDVEDDDTIVVEEPIEIRYAGEPVATVMRTPGYERELTAGYLFVEGWIDRAEDIAAIDVARRGSPGTPDARTITDLRPAPGATRPPENAVRRNTTSTSSCGICGKENADEAMLLRASPRPPRPLAPGSLSAPTIATLPDRLRERQDVFAATGALHAAGLFDLDGAWIVAREDIGRHNAVDAVIGHALLAGLIPLDRHMLQVSGRVSFEIVQKAHRAGIPVLAAVSGVSSLAVACAERAGIVLVGFARGGKFSLYSHAELLAER